MINPNSEGTIFMPPQASTVAADVDGLFYFIYFLCVVFFVLLAAGALIFLVKYRARHGGPAADNTITHNTALELAWSVIPLILLIVVFAWGFKVYLNLSIAPKDAMEIRVYAQRWNWRFEHPGLDQIKEFKELHVPVNKPIKLVMTAMEDPAGNVIHSFFVPAFRVKADVLPNRYNTLWFQATQPGSYQVYCTEYCGAGHSDMLAMVHVMEPLEFEKWKKSAGGPPAGVPKEEVGKDLFSKLGCTACHKSPQSPAAAVGPSMIGLMGRAEKLQDGSTVTADEEYIRESIRKPSAKIVANYPPAMPLVEIKDWQVDALIAYIKTLK